jgi:hypothetical protein
MFEENVSASINARCWEEALSVQDMLAPAPPRRTWRGAVIDRLLAAATSRRLLTSQARSSRLFLRLPRRRLTLN